MNKTDKKAQQWQQKQTKREYKLFVGEMKATNDSQGIVEGYLSTFGNIDYGLDRVMPGAFKRTLNNAYERKKASGDDYLWPYLWNHDYNLIPPGGIFDANEDKTGLFIKVQLNLDYQLARDMYSAYKAKMLKKQSMGYVSHQQEYVKEDGQMIRNLIEEEILEGSGVVFPMNDQADVTGVKRQQSGLYVPRSYWPGYTFDAESKGQASGKATWPLADRATKWDSGQATKDIEAWANGDWSKVAQCFFWVAQSPPTKLDECKLPFVAKVGGKMQAIPQGIISCAGVLQGAMGGADIDDEDAVKAKVATYYKKMDMTPPWEDDSGKGQRRTMDKKDFNDLYQASQAADCLEDWGDLINTLTQTMMQIFGMGDSPTADMTDALNQFSAAVMAWQEKAVECDLAGYISDCGYAGSETPYVPYTLRVGASSDYYGYMSRRNSALAGKAGAAFSQANTDAIHAHAATLHDMADEQCKSMHALADGFLGALQGLGAPSDPSYLVRGSSGDMDDGDSNNPKARSRPFTLARVKSGAEFSEDNLKMLGQHATGLHGIANTIHQMAEDLAENTGSQTYVDPDGNADTAKQTDKDKANSRSALRNKQHSPASGTADGDSQDDVASLFAGLQELGKTL